MRASFNGIEKAEFRKSAGRGIEWTLRAGNLCGLNFLASVDYALGFAHETFQ